MIDKCRSYLFPVSIGCLLVSLILLIISITTTSWVTIRITDEIHIPTNISLKFPNFKLPSSKLELEIQYTFGLTGFCVRTYNIQLETIEKQCHNIGVFQRDLEQASLQDAMKFEVLVIAFKVMSLVCMLGSRICIEGPLLRVTTYLPMAFMFFSGISSISSLLMVSNTFTESSSLVKYNILAHNGNTSDIDLQDITKGSSFNAAIASILFLILSLVFYIADYINEKREIESRFDTSGSSYQLVQRTDNENNS